MNGTSGFQEVQSSTSRSPVYPLLQKQQPQIGTGVWHLLPIKELPRMTPILPRAPYAR